MTSPQADTDKDEAALRRVFGHNFVDWILATDGRPARSQQQRKVAALVYQESQRATPEGAKTPAFLRLSRWTGMNPQTGRTFLTDLRRMAGGIEPVLPNPPEDEVLAALQAWAAENFGGLLLGESGFSLGWGGQAREQMTKAIAADSAFPFNTDSASSDALFHITTVGNAEGLQLAMLGPGIVAAAFRAAATRNPSPSVEDLLGELSGAIGTARAVYAGSTVPTLALAGLAGVLLPEEKQEIMAPWGRIRVAYETDNVWLDKQQDLTTMLLEDGSQLVSRGTGDLTIEMTLPWSAQFIEDNTAGDAQRSGPTTSANILHRRILDVRLGFALAMNDPQVPALLPTWEKIESPIADAGGFSMTELGRLRQRTPTRLSVEQAEAWELWIAALDGLALENLGHAPQRLLRAITERQDPVDALVDAVIVWEAIFGTHSEITFRVCGSLARLLCSTVDERLAFVKEAKGIYGMRSKIVHGASGIRPEKIHASRDEAVHVAIRTLRALVQDRPDLLAIADSGKRSERIMLE
ncbi:HEPN domain-containing protein [Streptomyces sp. WI04-05B]|uniref:HEPN domain-containing protein n=1 Tax=Streptomyces TaxID=1883 RepID=UPI0029A1937C|nr:MULTISPECIES: HEPN domain-containing protein [unclassified Streptomyces]MDX2544456.1 HEPN domain-containing protein [Streptomyces sp. WI04-05B]MDX2588475.1 HEPN domain-containing protein [Streptomyces sp. WI04-05A]